MARVTDRAGAPIDAGNMDLCIALNAVGVHTTFSCEGHLEEGSAFPYVRIGSTKNASALHEAEQRKLIPLLDAFYRVHPMVYDRHLILERILSGQALLRPQGADFQDRRGLSERAEKLAEYQREMQSFAEFLKEKFFEESKSMSLTEQLLADCEEHGAFLWAFKGRWFIALGEIMAVGGSLEEAVENWCQQVKQHPRLGPKVREIVE